MKCSNCGAELAPGVQSCPNCGNLVNLNKSTGQNQGFGQTSSFEQQGSGFDQQPGFNQQPGFGQNGQNGQNQGFGQVNYGYQQNYNNMPVNTNAPNFVLKLIIGLVYTCCCCNWLAGVLGIVFTCLMNQSYKNGDVAGYKSYNNVSTIIYIVGVALYIIGAILGFALGIFDMILTY